jgi:hypothetical protein
MKTHPATALLPILLAITAPAATNEPSPRPTPSFAAFEALLEEAGVAVDTNAAAAAVFEALARTADPQATLWTEPPATADTGTPAIITEKLPDGLALVRIHRLDQDSARAAATALHGWADTGRFGFILDLRGAGGDDPKAAATLAGLAASPGSLLFAFRTRDGNDRATFKAPEGVAVRNPMMVLIDGQTRGAAEVLAAALADAAKGALLIGQPTAGDPLVRELVPLPDGRLLRAATRQLVTAGGEVYNGQRRVEPGLLVDASRAAPLREEASLDAGEKPEGQTDADEVAFRERLEDDAALQRAVDVLAGLKALNLGPAGLSSIPSSASAP